jgi:MSHA pilin protein MshD
MLKINDPLQRGASMIELILFIIIVSIALAGILLVMNTVTGHSADTLIRKQALAIAESMLEEIELQDFSKPGGCFAGPYTPANRTNFDCVSNYAGFSTTGVYTQTNTPLAGLGGYNVAVEVVPSALGSIAAGSAVLITVTVTDTQGVTTPLSGYKVAL